MDHVAHSYICVIFCAPTTNYTNIAIGNMVHSWILNQLIS